MKRVIVMGHGGYAQGVKLNLEMIVGLPEHMHFIDLTKDDDLADLKSKVDHLLKEFNEDEVLFACDLLGASPFRVAAEICANNLGKYYTVAGLNTMAFLELSIAESSSNLSIEALANRAVETAKSAVAKFPE